MGLAIKCSAVFFLFLPKPVVEFQSVITNAFECPNVKGNDTLRDFYTIMKFVIVLFFFLCRNKKKILYSRTCVF